MAAGAMLLERLPRTTPSAGRGCRRDSEWGPAVPSRGVGRGRGKAGLWGEARDTTHTISLPPFLFTHLHTG